MGGGWGMESDRERRDRVREIKEILRQKKKSRESREKIGRGMPEVERISENKPIFQIPPFSNAEIAAKREK